MKLTIPLWLAVLLTATPVLTQAEDTAAQSPWTLLKKTSEAAHNVSYEGIFVFQSQQRMHSMGIKHVKLRGHEYVRIVALDGNRYEMLSDGNDTLTYKLIKDKLLIHKHRMIQPFPSIVSSVSKQLRNSYLARKTGTERIADKESIVLTLDPVDNLRYGYQFSIDQESGLLLKSVMLDMRGNPLETIAFTQINVLNTPDMHWYAPDMDSARKYPVQLNDGAETMSTAKNTKWTLEPLPAGYYKIEQLSQNVPGKKDPIDHLILSDGLASLSVFIEPAPEEAKSGGGYMQKGATNIYFVVKDGYKVLAIGKVPKPMVEKAVDLISFSK